MPAVTTDPNDADTDGDGIFDGVEVGITGAGSGETGCGATPIAATLEVSVTRAGTTTRSTCRARG